MSDAAYLRYTLHTRPAAGWRTPGAIDYPPAVAALLDLPVPGWQEAGDTLVFWLHVGSERNAYVATCLAALRRFGALDVVVEENDWQQAWRRFHEPVAVGELYIRPPWVPSRPGCLDVVIDVGMAFGTGTHASTRSCLQALCTLPRGSLLDLGTGSGVLALAALRLGHEPVYAVDCDEVAIAAAESNAVLNGLAPTYLLGDITDPRFALPQTNAVVANIALGPILALAQRYSCAETADAHRPWRPQHLVLAGLLAEQVDDVVLALPGYTLRERFALDEWALLHLEMR